MNRRNFLRTAGAAVATLATGAKSDAQTNFVDYPPAQVMVVLPDVSTNPYLSTEIYRVFRLDPRSLRAPGWSTNRVLDNRGRPLIDANGSEVLEANIQCQTPTVTIPRGTFPTGDRNNQTSTYTCQVTKLEFSLSNPNDSVTIPNPITPKDPTVVLPQDKLIQVTSNGKPGVLVVTHNRGENSANQQGLNELRLWMDQSCVPADVKSRIFTMAQNRAPADEIAEDVTPGSSTYRRGIRELVQEAKACPTVKVTPGSYGTLSEEVSMTRSVVIGSVK